jgi:uroporphyrinogen-III synthase
VVVACIGRVTAEAAAALGLKVCVVPQESTIGGLVDGLVDYFTGEHRGPCT